jgi:hypothetical protein
VYDREERKVFRYTLYNGDYTTKNPIKSYRNPIFMLRMTRQYNEIGYWDILEADELVEAYELGHLRGELKEIASKLHWEDNPVIMLVKHRNTKN